jgi:hypothetical protein
MFLRAFFYYCSLINLNKKNITLINVIYVLNINLISKNYFDLNLIVSWIEPSTFLMITVDSLCPANSLTISRASSLVLTILVTFKEFSFLTSHPIFLPDLSFLAET